MANLAQINAVHMHSQRKTCHEEEACTGNNLPLEGTCKGNKK
jgi:hypothetical protein